MRIAGGTPEAQHRVRLRRLEPAAAEETGVLVGLEVRHAHDDRLGIEGRGNRADALGELFDEEVGAGGMIADQFEHRVPLTLVADLLRMQQRERMRLDVLGDHEFHPREAHPVVGQEAALQGDLGIAEYEHDLGSGTRQLRYVRATGLERHRSGVDLPDISFGT